MIILFIIFLFSLTSCLEQKSTNPNLKVEEFFGEEFKLKIEIKDLERRLGYTFNNRLILIETLENLDKRLDSLEGDAILSSIVTSNLRKKFPNYSVGQLDQKRKEYVSNANLAKMSKEKLSISELEDEHSHGDLVEALIAAIQKDNPNSKAVNRVVLELVGLEIEESQEKKELLNFQIERPEDSSYAEFQYLIVSKIKELLPLHSQIFNNFLENIKKIKEEDKSIYLPKNSHHYNLWQKYIANTFGVICMTKKTNDCSYAYFKETPRNILPIPTNLGIDHFILYQIIESPRINIKRRKDQGIRKIFSSEEEADHLIGFASIVEEGPNCCDAYPDDDFTFYSKCKKCSLKCEELLWNHLQKYFGFSYLKYALKGNIRMLQTYVAVRYGIGFHILFTKKETQKYAQCFQYTPQFYKVPLKNLNRVDGIVLFEDENGDENGFDSSIFKRIIKYQRMFENFEELAKSKFVSYGDSNYEKNQKIEKIISKVGKEIVIKSEREELEYKAKQNSCWLEMRKLREEILSDGIRIEIRGKIRHGDHLFSEDILLKSIAKRFQGKSRTFEDILFYSTKEEMDKPREYKTWNFIDLSDEKRFESIFELMEIYPRIEHCGQTIILRGSRI